MKQRYYMKKISVFESIELGIYCLHHKKASGHGNLGQWMEQQKELPNIRTMQNDMKLANCFLNSAPGYKHTNMLNAQDIIKTLEEYHAELGEAVKAFAAGKNLSALREMYKIQSRSSKH